MPRTTVGLDIGSAGVRAAELSVGGGTTVLQRFGQVALEPGVVRDGEVVDGPAVSAALEQLWSAAGFRTKRVVIGVANQKVVVRQVEVPWLAPAELKRSLPFQVQEFIPMPVEQAILDLLPIEELESDSGARTLRGLLVAASKEMVSSLLSAVTAAGLTPVMVDLTPFAVLRSTAQRDHLGLDPDAEALIDVGAGVTNIVVHQGGVPRFVRILLMGGSDISEALVDRLGVPFEQAETLKRDLGLPLHDPVDAGPRALDSAGAAFVQEVRSTLDYYTAQPTSARLTRIALSGGGSRLLGLDERLRQVTRLPVDHVTPLARLAVGKTGLTPEQLDSAAPLMSVSVGLALGAAA